MHWPQLLVYESDGVLAEALRELAQDRRWALREPRQPAECLRFLRRGGPAVLLLRLGRDMVRELTLLDRAHTVCPEAVRVVIGDVDDPALEEFAWDLGASYTLFPPRPREEAPALVVALMEAAIHSWPAFLAPAAGAAGSEETS